MYVMEYYTYHLRAYGYIPRYQPSLRHGFNVSPHSQTAVTAGLKAVQGVKDGKNRTTVAFSLSGNQTKEETVTEEKETENLSSHLTVNRTAVE